MITIFDTETTDLLKPKGNSLSVQPHIVEIYAAQIDMEDDEKIVCESHHYLRAPVPSSKGAFATHRITEEFLRDKPVFGDVWVDIADAFFGSHTVVGHNLSFDMWMIIFELQRIGKEFNFPYPPIWFCTVEQSMHLRGHRLKLSELFKIATDKEMVDAHQAKVDVMADFECYKYLVGE